MSNPLLTSLKIPGEIVRLPSGGLFYDEGVIDPSVTNAEVTVYPMSAYDEICMRNIGEVINGRSISNVFSRCIPQILQPDELSGKDVDTLFMVLRKVTYGSTLMVTYKHDCEESKTHKYSISLNNILNTVKYIDPSLIDDEFTVVLENGQVVQLRPLKFKDILSIMSDAKDIDYNDFSHFDIQQKLLRSTVHLIKSVDDIKDPALIQEWLDTIPVTWFTQITDKSGLSNSWGTENTYTITCEDCGKEIVIDVPVNPLTFFLDF
jgi:hypothetical protein